MPFFRHRPELLVPFRKGERHAMEAVYWAYVGPVERIARHGCMLARNSGDTRTAQRVQGALGSDLRDIVQETFARAFQPNARLAYDGIREYGPWLATIARNVLIDWARSKARTLFVEDLPTTAVETLEEADRAGWAEDPATETLVEQYIAALEPELRRVHEQRYVLGQSQFAAAEALGITRQRLRTLERHLQKGLARELRRFELLSARKK